MKKTLHSEFSRAISSLDQKSAVELLASLIECIGDEPEPILKYRMIFEALIINFESEKDKIALMPDDSIKNFAFKMIQNLEESVRKSLDDTRKVEP